MINEFSLWSGYWDAPREGVFSDVNTGRPLSAGDYQPWWPGEPNGGIIENCAVVWAFRDMWNDYTCDIELCGFCELEEVPVFQIRGGSCSLSLWEEL